MDNGTNRKEERLLALIPDCPPRKRPLKPPRPILAVYRKLSVEGQRERVVHAIKELAEAERNAVHRDQRQTNLCYRRLYEALGEAEHWANGGV